MYKQDNRLAVRGTYIHAPKLGEIEVVESALIVVGAAGAVEQILLPDDPSFEANCRAAKDAGHYVQLRENQYLLPGLVDLHVHAPQWPQAGRALRVPLEQWLQQYTFPLEARYSDIEFAQCVYQSLVNTLLANGTTTALYFASIHLESSLLLAQICLESGQRALVGKVSMDNPEQCPDYYREQSTSAGLATTEAFICGVKSLPNNQLSMVRPVVTPRFIPSCTDEMLLGLGQIANQHDCHVQTHCSESEWEHQYVLDRFGKSDTECLADMGLANGKSVFAHANFVSDEDMTIIHEAAVGIAHCPMSNIYFANSVFPTRKALNTGINVGLGTDIAGGPSPSLLFNCQMATSMSRILESGVDPTLRDSVRGVADSRLTFQEAFWMATAGGGAALGENIGVFKPGYCFDAIVVDFNVEHSNIANWPELENADEQLEKIIYNANRQNIVRVWVNGQTVVDRASSR